MFNNLVFRNFSIGKKLYSGFIILIILISGMSVYSIYSFKIIQANAEKTDVVNKIGHLLDIARRNRLLFQQTGDEQAMKANGEAISNMQSLTRKSEDRRCLRPRMVRSMMTGLHFKFSNSGSPQY